MTSTCDPNEVMTKISKKLETISLDKTSPSLETSQDGIIPSEERIPNGDSNHSCAKIYNNCNDIESSKNDDTVQGAVGYSEVTSKDDDTVEGAEGYSALIHNTNNHDTENNHSTPSVPPCIDPVLACDPSMDKSDLAEDIRDLVLYRDREHRLYYRLYKSELDMPDIVALITKDLSEPYSIYTYRYFIHNWPKLCLMAFTEENQCVGAVVCKLEWHHPPNKRGYIAMLAVEQDHRRKKIGSTLVKLVIQLMSSEDCDEVVLETEVTNKPAMHLYENLGFCRDKRLFRYYLNGVDAFRLKLWLK